MQQQPQEQHADVEKGEATISAGAITDVEKEEEAAPTGAPTE